MVDKKRPIKELHIKWNLKILQIPNRNQYLFALPVMVRSEDELEIDSMRIGNF